MTIPMTCSNEDCEADYEVEVTMTSPPVKGKLTGPWEDCYPAEDAEYDVTGPEVCACGEVLDTPANWTYAIAQAEQAAAEWGI